MKKSLFPLLIGSSMMLAAQNASASVLVAGFHSFTGTTATQNAADFSRTGFSGSVVKGTNSVATGGDTDGFYGNSTYAVTGAAPTNDGYGRVSGTSTLVFSVTNNSGASLSLESFLFDAVASTAPGTGAIIPLVLDYSTDGGAHWSTATSYTPAATTNSNTPGSQQDYSDFVLNLASVTLANTASIQFRFAGSARIDNVALTAVPETSSTIALGGLLGAGVFFRSRRRSVIA